MIKIIVFVSLIGVKARVASYLPQPDGRISKVIMGSRFTIKNTLFNFSEIMEVIPAPEVLFTFCYLGNGFPKPG